MVLSKQEIEKIRAYSLVFVLKNKGHSLKTQIDFEERKWIARKTIAKAYEWLHKHNLTFISMIDTKYPNKFRYNYDRPPFVIFVNSKGRYILDSDMDYEKGRIKLER